MNYSGRWEHLTLESIETRLGEADPALASLLTMFTRLASSEEMPGCERIQTPLRHPPRRGRRCRPGCRSSRPRSALLVWLVVSLALITVAVVLSHGSAPGCARTSVAECGR